jgi:transcriptional regulator with XRE-family HTH domain
MESLLLQLGTNVKELREHRGLSQQALAQQVGVTRNTIARLERGAQNPTITLVALIAAALGVRLTTLVRNCKLGD